MNGTRHTILKSEKDEILPWAEAFVNAYNWIKKQIMHNFISKMRFLIKF